MDQNEDKAVAYIFFFFRLNVYCHKGSSKYTFMLIVSFNFKLFMPTVGIVNFSSCVAKEVKYYFWMYT